MRGHLSGLMVALRPQVWPISFTRSHCLNKPIQPVTCLLRESLPSRSSLPAKLNSYHLLCSRHRWNLAAERPDAGRFQQARSIGFRVQPWTRL